jgi:hypothetical protein
MRVNEVSDYVALNCFRRVLRWPKSKNAPKEMTPYTVAIAMTSYPVAKAVIP